MSSLTLYVFTVELYCAFDFKQFTVDLGIILYFAL